MVFGRIGEFFRGDRPRGAVEQHDAARAAQKSVDASLTDAPERASFTKNPDGVPEGVEAPVTSSSGESSAFGREATGADVPESQLTPDELTEEERLAVVGIRAEHHKPEAFAGAASDEDGMAAK